MRPGPLGCGGTAPPPRSARRSFALEASAESSLGGSAFPVHVHAPFPLPLYPSSSPSIPPLSRPISALSTPPQAADCPMAARLPLYTSATPAAPGEVLEGGIEAMRRVIQECKCPVTVLSLAPMCNIKALVDNSGGEGADGDLLGRANLVMPPHFPLAGLCLSP